MGVCYGERAHRAFDGEETAPKGIAAEWCASIRALCSAAHLPHAIRRGWLRCLDTSADRGPLFDCHVCPVRSPERRCRDESVLPSPDAEGASSQHTVG